MARPKSSPAEIEQRKKQIVAGARRCFAEFGFDGTTVEHLEHECGVTRGTLFRYYPSKTAMLAEVFAAEEAAQRPQYEAILAAISDGHTDALEATMLLQLQRAAQDPVPTLLRLQLLALGRRDAQWALPIRRLEEQQYKWRGSLVAQALAESGGKQVMPQDQLTDVLSVIFLGLAVNRAMNAPLKSSDQVLAGTLAAMVNSVARVTVKPEAITANRSKKSSQPGADLRGFGRRASLTPAS